MMIWHDSTQYTVYGLCSFDIRYTVYGIGGIRFISVYEMIFAFGVPKEDVGILQFEFTFEVTIYPFCKCLVLISAVVKPVVCIVNILQRSRNPTSEIAGTVAWLKCSGSAKKRHVVSQWSCVAAAPFRGSALNVFLWLAVKHQQRCNLAGSGDYFKLSNCCSCSVILTFQKAWSCLKPCSDWGKTGLGESDAYRLLLNMNHMKKITHHEWLSSW